MFGDGDMLWDRMGWDGMGWDGMGWDGWRWRKRKCGWTVLLLMVGLISVFT
jgi:hypothetical protein